jgi:ligand-binding SRPBCC domain-containing protein
VKTYELRTRIRLPRRRPEVFAFFGDAGNLQAITPPWLHFQILTPMPLAMHSGAILEYRIRVHAVPVRWRTEITAWEPPLRFVDEQRRGPYRLWVHEHTFQEIDHGGVPMTEVTDRVSYQVPGGAPIDSILNRLVVARDLKAIFTFRSQTLLRLFGGRAEDAEPVVIAAVNE